MGPDYQDTAAFADEEDDEGGEDNDEEDDDEEDDEEKKVHTKYRRITFEATYLPPSADTLLSILCTIAHTVDREDDDVVDVRDCVEKRLSTLLSSTG